MKKFLSFSLALLFLLSLPQFAFALPQPEKTTVKGISSSITASHNKKLSRVITVKPSTGGRTVRLQLYLSGKDKYKTIKTYHTEDAPSAKVKIVFPKKWRKKRTGKWRILVLKSDTAKPTIKNLTVTTKNIVVKKVTAKAVCVYCVEDKKVVYGVKINKRRKQASTTKVMTSILLLENAKLKDTTKISKNAADTLYSHPVMKAGDVYSNKDLLYTMLLPSSNGSAVAVAEEIGGSVSGFADMMNAKAKELGLKNTRFVNPHGLDEKSNYSTAFDLCRQMAYIYPESKSFRKAISTSSYTFTTKKYKYKYTVKTTDELKNYSSKHKGGKTGTTSLAGCCFTSVYVDGGKTYTVAVLGSADNESRFSDTKKLYSYIDKYANTSY